MKKNLFLDGSLHPCRIGLCHHYETAKWHGRAVDGLFSSLDELFKTRRMSPEDVECIVACAGPGNKMGLRAVKMFIGTAEAIGMGKPIYAYNGLEAEARWIVRSMSLRDFSVIAPIGKKRGAAITVTGGILGKTFAVENSNFSGNGRTFAMDTGFLPADGNFEAAPEVPPNFLIGALATMAQSKTFAPIEL